MKNTLISAALRFALKDIHSLLAFVGTLESKIEAYLEKEKAKALALEADIQALAEQKAKLLSNIGLATSIQRGVSNLRG